MTMFKGAAAALLGALLLAGQAGAAGKGFITVKQEEGRWWFVDGKGKSFFFNGPNCVAGCYGHYEREPLAKWREERALQVLKGWGFNAAGCWSSPSVWDDFPFADQIYPGYEIPMDYFDEPAWVPGLKKALLQETKAFIGNRNFVGYFLDNEPKWTHEKLFPYFRGLKSTAPGAKALVAFMKERYKGDLKALNAAWGSQLASFDELVGKKPVDARKSKKDQVAWATHCAARYYEIYAKELRAIDPDHLLVGIRHAGIPDPEFAAAISKPFDVISINNYTRFGALDRKYAEIYKASGKPIMITEWSFSGYPATGRKSLQYIEVYSQEAKGQGYYKFTKEMAQAPFMVGSHWFLYTDYDTGTFMKGPYYPDENMGLVSADEKTAYEEFGKWVKKANSQVHGWHAKSEWKPGPTPTPEAVAFPALSPKVDGRLEDWPAALARTPRLGGSLREKVEIRDQYYFAADDKNLYVAARIHDDSVDAIEPGWNWECDYLGITLGPKDDKDEFKGSYISLLPSGGGDAKGIGPDPYAMCWSCKPGYGPLASVTVERRYMDEERAYTIEAAIPLKDLSYWDPGVKAWEVGLFYHNNSGVYETNWSGLAGRAAK